MDKSDVDKGTSDGTDGIKVKKHKKYIKSFYYKVLIKSYSNCA